MNWEEARVIRTEDNRYQWRIMEAVEIRNCAHRTMNRELICCHIPGALSSGSDMTAGGVVVLSNLTG